MRTEHASVRPRDCPATLNLKNGLGINTLTSAEPGCPNGGAVFHDTAVWIRSF